MAATTLPVAAGLVVGALFVLLFSLYSSQTIRTGNPNATIQGQSNIVSFTKHLPIVREFLKRFPDANITIVNANNMTEEIGKKYNNDLGEFIVKYSVERDLYQNEGHRELRLTIYVSKNYTIISSGMSCLGPVSSELSRTEPDMWIEAEKCIAK